MFENIRQQWKIKKIVRNWRKSSLGQTIDDHTINFFDRYPRLSELSEDFKEEIRSEFYAEVLSYFQSDNPFLAVRNALAKHAAEYAFLTIVSLTKEDKAATPIVSDCPYVSGELSQHIDKIAEQENQIHQLKWKNPDLSDEEMVDICLTRGVIASYRLLGANYVRIELGDFDDQRDWFHPFMEAQMIWEEDVIRGDIGLPSLLDDGAIDSLAYSLFAKFITDGFENPLYEWDKFTKKIGGENSDRKWLSCQ